MTTMLARRAAHLPPSATATLDARLKALAAEGRDIINLTAGETDFPTPHAANEGGVQAIAQGFTRYTAVAGIPELREAIGLWLKSRYGVDRSPQRIVVSNGAKQALFNAFMVLLDPGDEVLLPAPYWVSFPHMISLAGGVPVVVPPGPGFKVTPESVRAHTTSRTRVLLINNPVNPTGVVYSEPELAALVRVAEELGLTLVSDEIYDELVYDPDGFTSVAELSDHAVIVGGVSKTFAMTGWRIGYAVAPVPVAQAMAAVQGHTTSAASSVSQRAALAALTAAEFMPELARRRDELDQRRRLLVDGIRSIPGMRVPVEPTGAFFLLAEIPGGSAPSFAQALLDAEGVGVVPGDAFGAPGHVRISYTTHRSRLREAIRRIHHFTTEV